VLRAVGVRPLAVWLELLKETLLLGVAGSLLGIPMGIGLAHVSCPDHHSGGTQLQSCHAASASHDPGVGAGARVAVGLTAALVAAALPAWRAARRES